MLARTFLSAEELRIPQKWHDALIKTLHAMERGEFHHIKDFRLAKMVCKTDRLDPANFHGSFNMDNWNVASEKCGTVCCIGGAAEIIGGVRFLQYGCSKPDAVQPDWLSDLFFPGVKTSDVSYDKITVEQATEALRRALTLGDAQWESILEVSK